MIQGSTTSPAIPTPVPPGTRVIARYSYDAEKMDELSLQVDDVVHVLESPEGGWWRGMIGLGKTTRIGWFPANLVEVLNDVGGNTSAAESDKEGSVTNASPTSARPASKWFSKLISSGKSDDESSSGPSNTKKIPRTRSVSMDATATTTVATSKSIGAIQGSTTLEVPLTIEGLGSSVSLKSQGASSDMLDHGKRRHTVSNLLSAKSDSLTTSSLTITRSWKDEAPASVVDKLSPDERKRQEVIWELLCTERDYFRDLKIILEVCLLAIKINTFRAVGVYGAHGRKETAVLQTSQFNFWKSRIPGQAESRFSECT